VKPSIRRPRTITSPHTNAIIVEVPQAPAFTQHAKRAIDVGFAAGVICVLAPLLALGMLFARSTGRIFCGPICLARGSIPFEMHVLACDRTPLARLVGALGLARATIVFDLLLGRVSLVGPRLVEPGELAPEDPRVIARHTVRPGLVAPLARPGQSALDRDVEYVSNISLLRDAGVLLGALVRRR